VDIVLNLKLIQELGLTINEYLILYNIANNNQISSIFNYSLKDVVKLEKEMFLKITHNGVFLRTKAEALFSVVGEDYFASWLEKYPIKVTKRNGGSRSLSPASADTILGKTLRKKWDTLFKKDTESQKRAILVLELQVTDMTRSGDLEYMVEARRWLNEGYFEKYEYLVDEQKDRSKFENEDFY